jgi:hypothetical protein
MRSCDPRTLASPPLPSCSNTSWPATPPQHRRPRCTQRSTIQRFQLGHATARYLDALHIAAEHIADPQMINDLDSQAEQLINRLTEETAWPAFRNRLLLMALDNDTDPVASLRDTTQLRELDSAADQTAVLNWRLDDTQLHNPAAPLPWLPGIPDRIATDPNWGPYLAARARLITDLADQVRTTGQVAAQVWMVERRCQPAADLVAEIHVWRAATQVEQADLRPTGPKQPSLLAQPGNTDSTRNS